MGLVIEGVFAMAVIAGIGWLWSLRRSVIQDASAARAAATQDAQARERAAREANLYRTKEKLRCLGCDTDFAGPLTEAGCPNCHLSSLVVTDEEYRRGRELSAGD